jgi:hypothetical protein
VYFSGVLQGPATAFAGFRDGFVAFLSQRYGYKGVVGCAPANTAAIAQNALNTRSAQLRSQKKNVVETGWTEPAAVAAAQPAPAPAAKTVAPAAQQAAKAGGAGSGSSELNSILAAVFGTGGGASAGGTSAGGAKGTAGGASPGSGAAGGSGGTGDQGGVAQVAGTLATVFSNKSSGASDAGAQSVPKPEGLGSALAENTKLVVYGCGRQDTQVACVTELTNQNQKDTLVQSANIWKDTFIVDDRGDRHPRSNGFFLNIDGDQRSQLDISYGKAARFILMFDGVPAKVQKVALRSTAVGLDVEDIILVAPSSDAEKR